MKITIPKCRCGYQPYSLIDLYNHAYSCPSKANWKGNIHSGNLDKNRKIQYIVYN